MAEESIKMSTEASETAPKVFLHFPYSLLYILHTLYSKYQMIFFFCQNTAEHPTESSK